MQCVAVTAFVQHLHCTLSIAFICPNRVRVAERLALPTSDHGVAGSNPAGGKILPEPKRRFIAQSLSCSPFHRLEMTEILLKGRKSLTHPSIHVPIEVCTQLVMHKVNVPFMYFAHDPLCPYLGRHVKFARNQLCSYWDECQLIS